MADWLCHECKKKPGDDQPHRWWCSKANRLDEPMRVATRPQDWAEPARSIIFGRMREKGRGDSHG